jgi:hypothetical protein
MIKHSPEDLGGRMMLGVNTTQVRDHVIGEGFSALWGSGHGNNESRRFISRRAEIGVGEEKGE